MNAKDLTTIDQLTAFLEGTQRVAFEVANDKDSRYQWIQRTLVKFRYKSLRKADTNTILAHYRGLWAIEESFRIQKHDLEVRPVFHWTESRIRAHLAIAFMAFCCVRHLAYRVALHLQYKKLSPQVIRGELAHVQVSLLEDQNTQSVYGMPSSVSPDAEKIYQVMGIKPVTTAYRIS